MKALTLLIAFSLVSCSRDEEAADIESKSSPMRVEAGLEQHVEAFLLGCRNAGVNCPTDGLTVQWSNYVGSDLLGYCSRTSNNRHVYILRQTGADRAEIPLTVAHELGHCILGLDHTKGDAPHVMRATAFYSDERNQKPIQEWINEMFDGLESKNELRP